MEQFVEMLNGFVVPTIVILCGLTGYVVKKWIPDVENRLIPTIVTIEGAIIACITSVSAGQAITVEIITGGALSGLLSTGCYEFLKSWITRWFNVGQSTSDNTTNE